MTATEESHLPGEAAVLAADDRLLTWLRDQALPLWDRHGVDRRAGGFFESLSAGAPRFELEAAGSVRRGRVVARQTYVFDLGRRLGWRSACDSPAEHGCNFLLSHLQADDGLFHTAVDAQSRRPQASFSLYEQAFCLFALARLNPSAATRLGIEATAMRCLERLRSVYGRTLGGFEESQPRSLPLKSNPHMHLLEAALEWIAAARGNAQRPWIDLARELVGLCLTRFRDASTGAIREYFDYQWQAMPGEDGHILEPGHQFEWAWLLMQWANSPHCGSAERAACLGAARCLIEIAETWGVDAGRGVAINELWDDMTAKDSAAKFWPQTERLKAWCAVLEQAETAADAGLAGRNVVAAAAGVTKYLRADIPGLWYETCLPDGTFPEGPCKASSFYHVAGAIEVLRRTAGGLRARVPKAPFTRLSAFTGRSG
jgi:mannose-6-phosphate isomerase